MLVQLRPPGYTCNFLLTMVMQFQEVIVLPDPTVKFLSCAGNATTSEKLHKNYKL